MANERRNEDQEQIADDNVAGKASEENEEFDNADELDDSDDDSDEEGDEDVDED